MSRAIDQTAPAVSAELASLVREAEPPEDVVDAARSALAGAVAAAVVGADGNAAAAARRVAAALGTPARASVLGTADRLSPPMAALVNGTAAASASREPAAAVVVAAALAVAEHAGVGLETLWRAVAVGLETHERLARALGDGHEARGWVAAGTAGHIGAVSAACAAMPSMTHGQVVQALGLAATQAGGLGAAEPTDVGPLQLGKAAADGVEAALLTVRGFTAPAQGIEGRRGLFTVMGLPAGHAAAVTDGIGATWVFPPLVSALVPQSSTALSAEFVESLMSACAGTGRDGTLAALLAIACPAERDPQAP